VVLKPRTTFLLIFLALGLFLAQWQGFSHGIAHGLVVSNNHEQVAHVAHAHQVEDIKSKDVCEQSLTNQYAKHESDGNHHCAAYDSQTLSASMPSLPLSLPAIDKTNAAINSYTTYQASIEAYRPFDVRGPPTS
jgi:hypothetical protein